MVGIKFAARTPDLTCQASFPSGLLANHAEISACHSPLSLCVLFSRDPNLSCKKNKLWHSGVDHWLSCSERADHLGVVAQSGLAVLSPDAAQLVAAKGHASVEGVPDVDPDCAGLQATRQRRRPIQI